MYTQQQPQRQPQRHNKKYHHTLRHTNDPSLDTLALHNKNRENDSKHDTTLENEGVDKSIRDESDTLQEITNDSIEELPRHWNKETSERGTSRIITDNGRKQHIDIPQSIPTLETNHIFEEMEQMHRNILHRFSPLGRDDDDYDPFSGLSLARNMEHMFSKLTSTMSPSMMIPTTGSSRTSFIPSQNPRDMMMKGDTPRVFRSQSTWSNVNGEVHQSGNTYFSDGESTSMYRHQDADSMWLHMNPQQQQQQQHSDPTQYNVWFEKRHHDRVVDRKDATVDSDMAHQMLRKHTRHNSNRMLYPVDDVRYSAVPAFLQRKRTPSRTHKRDKYDRDTPMIQSLHNQHPQRINRTINNNNRNFSPHSATVHHTQQQQPAHISFDRAHQHSRRSSGRNRDTEFLSSYQQPSRGNHQFGHNVAIPQQQQQFHINNQAASAGHYIQPHVI